MSSMFEMIAIGMATVAAVASAFAAWKSSRTSESALKFQKQFSKNQRNIARIQAIITKLHCLKNILLNALDTPDEKFLSLETLHREIRSELEGLIEEGVLPPRKSEFLEVTSFAKIVGQQPHAYDEIDEEIKRLEGKIGEVFA